MIADTKLVLSCLFALIIGVASVVPIAYVMAKEAFVPRVDVEAALGDKTPLDFNLTYAYIGDYWLNNSHINDENYGWKVCVNFRTTPNIDLNTLPYTQSFAAFEFYTVQVSTEKGVIATVDFSSYTYSRGFAFLENNSLQLRSYSLGLFSNNNSENSQRGINPASLGIYENGTGHGQLLGSAIDWESDGKPQAMSITVKRLGYVIIDDGNTTIQYTSSEPIAHVELEPYGDGFMYNKLFNQEELAQINPVMPQFKYMR